MKRFDVIVLGAGMVGISTSIHLLKRGRSVALVDRRGPAEETSYGNAGLIQAEAVMPYAFPRALGTILEVLTGRSTDARIAWRAIGQTAPWLVRYAMKGGAGAVRRTALANAPLVARAVPAHRELSEAAGATDQWRSGGYIRLYQTARTMDADLAVDSRVKDEFGIPYEPLDPAGLAEAEPHLRGPLAGGVRMPEPIRIEDPGALGKAYARHFEGLGGVLLTGDAMSLSRASGAFTLETVCGTVAAREAVLCLGPWSSDLLAQFGVRLPLGVKRGYHQHYRPMGNAVLNNLLVDMTNGFVMAPNRRGIRITSGAEFARRDDPPSPVQLEQVEPIARQLFPLSDAEGVPPWMGARPCFPDLLPAIGKIPKVDGLWCNTGHHHLGFTLGPATGALLAEMLTGGTPFTDPAPYAPTRFKF